MSKVALCLVGAGVMGSRHVGGMAVLERLGIADFELAAVCDLRADNAARVADQAEKSLGCRPAVHLSVDAALADPSIDAFVVVTEAFSHIAVVPQILRAGKHVLCEKPLALTVRSCRALLEAEREGGAILATAENYRRDPTNRLARAVLDAGLIGDVHLMSQTMIGGGRDIIITPWRHFKDKGAIGLDMGVHFTDLIRYYLGEIDTIYGQGFIAEPERSRPREPVFQTDDYLARFAEMPERITATGEDSLVALFTTRGGVPVQLAYIASGARDHRITSRVIHGGEGMLEIPNDRTGGAARLRTDRHDIAGRDLLALLPDFALDDVTAAIFGADGVTYDLPAGRADAGLLAIEQHDFCAAIRDGRPPEVDGADGALAVAALLGVYESGIAHRPVTLNEMMDSAIDAYQRPIDAELGLLDDRLKETG